MNSTNPPGRQEHPQWTPLRILVAEEDAEIRDVLGSLLSREGYVVEAVDNAHRALNRVIASAEAFDVVITEHNLPRLNGLALVTRLRRTAFGGKILVLAALLSPQNHVLYEGLRVDAIFLKPSGTAPLLKKLAEFQHKSG